MKAGQAARTCAAADRTGHASAAHAIPGQHEERDTVFFNEWYAADMVKNQDGAVVGVVAICMETGETVYVKSKATVFATGVARDGSMPQPPTRTLIPATGSGMALRAGVPGSGYGDVAVPPDGDRRSRHTGDGGLSRRGRLPGQQGWRALHGAIRAKCQGPCRSRRGGAVHGTGDPGRAGAADPNGDHVKLKLDHLGEDVLESRSAGNPSS